MISHGDATISFIGEGVNPEAEAVVSRAMNLTSGQNLASDNRSGITLGRGLAENLGVRVDDTVVLLATTPAGSINAVESRYEVCLPRPARHTMTPHYGYPYPWQRDYCVFQAAIAGFSSWTTLGTRPRPCWLCGINFETVAWTSSRGMTWLTSTRRRQPC